MGTTARAAEHSVSVRLWSRIPPFIYPSICSFDPPSPNRAIAHNDGDPRRTRTRICIRARYQRLRPVILHATESSPFGSMSLNRAAHQSSRPLLRRSRRESPLPARAIPNSTAGSVFASYFCIDEHHASDSTSRLLEFKSALRSGAWQRRPTPAAEHCLAEPACWKCNGASIKRSQLSILEACANTSQLRH